MKNAISVLLALCLVFSFQAMGQPAKKKKKNVEAKQLDAAVKAMIKVTDAKKPAKGVCGSGPSVFVFPATNELSFVPQIQSFQRLIKTWDSNTYLKKGYMTSPFNYAFLQIDIKDTFPGFVRKVSNIEFGKLTKKQKDDLRNMYDILRLLLGGIPILSSDYVIKPGCYVEMGLFLKLTKKNHQGIRWKLSSVVEMNCDCKTSTYKIKHLKYEYSALIDGVLSSEKIEFKKPKAANFKILDHKCCPGVKVGMADPFGEVPETQNASLPNQMFGGNAGVGFAQNFDETSFCLGVEYLYNATDLGNSPLYVGGHANVATSSFMESSRTWFSVGPTVQVFSPITPSGQTQLTNGVSGAYIFGTNDNGGFKDDISGFQIALNTGVNIQLSSNVSLSIVIPVVTHQNLTFEAQEGGASFKTDDTTLLLNKNNPAKLGVRFGF